MEKYSKHFLLDIQSVKDYAKEILDIFDNDEELESSEIGDGNINYVFKVVGKVSKKSVVIKQADKLLRSSGRPLDMNRNKIEVEMLKLQGKLSPKYLPEIYHYHENMYAVSMEDISDYKNLRKEMISGKIFEHFSDNISSFLADTLLPTTDLVMDRAVKKEMVKTFTNIELCDISEDLVFTEPYYNYKNRNVIIEQNLSYVEENIYGDMDLHSEVGKLRDYFMNHAQALIHGDLHSGSIFANSEGIKIIDPEFAFYGPMGYDIGNVIGNLFFAWINRYFLEPNDERFLFWIENTIKDVIDKFLEKFEKKYNEIVEFPLYKTENFKKDYISSVLAYSLGYAGTEIIRRVVGDAKVLEITSISDIDKRVLVEKVLIQIGIELIKQRNFLKNGKETTKLANDIIGNFL